MITFESKGDWGKTEKFLKKLGRGDIYKAVENLARRGVDALSKATPVESGLTAASWGYEVKIASGVCTITWLNTNIVKGVPIAIILQYGHGTGTGGYVQGRDYINPAIRPIFDEISDAVWKEVTSA